MSEIQRRINLINAFLKVWAIFLAFATSAIIGGFFTEILKFPIPVGIAITIIIFIFAIGILTVMFEEENEGFLAIF